MQGEEKKCCAGLTGSIVCSCLPWYPGEKLKKWREIGVEGEAKRDSKTEIGGNRNRERDREKE